MRTILRRSLASLVATGAILGGMATTPLAQADPALDSLTQTQYHYGPFGNSGECQQFLLGHRAIEEAARRGEAAACVARPGQPWYLHTNVRV